MTHLIPWSISWGRGLNTHSFVLFLLCWRHPERCPQMFHHLWIQMISMYAINKLAIYLNGRLLCFTCGHCPPDVARLTISFIVFFRESGSTRDTSTGCRARNSPLRQTKGQRQVFYFFFFFLAKATIAMILDKS